MAVAALLLSGLVVAPARSAAADPRAPQAALDWRAALDGVKQRGPVPESPPVTKVRSAPAAPSGPAAAPTATTLPAAASAELTLGRAGATRQVGKSPIGLAAGAASAAGRTVRVDILDSAAAARAGVSGFVFRVSGPGGTALEKKPLPVALSIHYSTFAERFGAGYADRLRVVALPRCVLANPVPAGCAVGGKPVPSHHDRGTSRLVATIGDLASVEPTAAPRGRPTAAAPAGAAAVLAVTSEPEGEDGSFKATPLSLSGDWQVNTGSGNFTYSYEVPLAAAPAGPTPKVGLMYSSGAVDGMVSGKNTQSGQVGLGWNEFADSFIERRYNSCLTDGQVYADLCWKSDNATISLNGKSGELVQVPGSNPKQWRIKDDPRWRVEQLTGADNGDDNGEHWRVSTPDGVQYFFGRGVNPDVGVATESAWTVPVFGDDAGEPCSTNTPVPWCTQAWRWNLDLVIDPHDNVQQWEYDKEIDYYAALNGWPGLEHTPYVRSGVLRLIKYGKRRTPVAETIPSAEVGFTVDYRCLALDHTCPAPTTGTASNFPDTPVDLMCLSAICSRHTPTFFTTLRYSKVTTYVNDADSDDRFVEVDRVKLNHGLPDPDPNRTGDQKLFLQSVQRTGLKGLTGDEITLPPVTFTPVLLNNRIDTGGTLSAMPHYRVGVITNEYGGQVHVTYGQPHPCPAPIPDPPNWHLNTRDCFPHWHSPDGGTAGFAVFHKYVVTRVEERDPLGGSPTMVTTYRYGDQVQAGLPNGAWHHDRDEFASNATQTWSEWRGYADVVVGQGSTRTQYRLFRGMHGDRLVADPFPGPGSRAATTASLDGTVTGVNDENRLAGLVLDEQSLRTNGTVESGVVHGYHNQRTVDAPGPDPFDDAWFVAPNDTTERRRNPADGGYVRRRTQTVYNGILGTVDKVIEHGRTTTAGDERCTVTLPTFNADRWMLDFAVSVTRYASATCDGPEVSREEYAYDGGAFGAAPTRGDRTGSRVKITAAPTWATTTTTYDRLGRPLAVTDPNGHTTTTSHSPEIRYPATTTVTNHLGHVQKTNWFRPRQAPAVQTDARGKKTSISYDALGRTVGVHQATEQAAGAPASYEFGYDIDPAKARVAVVRTRRLQDSAGGSPRYVDSWVLHDTWLRARQTHQLSPESGTVLVTNTSYDDRGLVAGTSSPQALPGSPGQNILPTPSGGWANETATAYDELGRPSWEISWAAGAYRRSVLTEYTHDTTTTTPDPPSGGVIRAVTDAYDRTVKVEELDGSTWRPTTYGYDAADRPTTVKDPANNTITNTYDLAGRKTAMTDPDLGSWTYGYDAVGNETRSTSAAGSQLHTAYDPLNRKTERRRDSTSGPLLAKWEYDAAGERGLLNKSTRFDPTGTWVIDVTGYDDRARPTGRTWTVPAGVSGLAGNYPVGYGYDAADHKTRISYPAVGGLAAETVTTTYNALGLPDTMVGAEEYVWGAIYDNRARPTWLLSGSRSVPFSRVYEYNTDQRLGALKAGAGSTSLQDIRFGYDTTFGNVVERNTTLAGQASRECYDHDDRQRMTRAFTTTGTCAAGTPGTGTNPYNHTYTYSADGNLTTRVEGAATITYAYPAAGGTRPHAPTAVGANSYAWTADGDLASRTVAGQTETLTWDAERHLTLIDDPDGDSTFGYDADGGRLLRRTAAGTTVYIEGHEITKPTAGSTTAVRTYGFAETLTATRTPGGVEYVATDNQGSVQLTVPTGATAPSKTRTYQPYGKPRGTDTTSTDRGWIGQVEDKATGLDYLNARYYDPTIGRFISPDPLFDTAKPQTVNPYAYGVNNPVAFADPSGLIIEECRTGEIQCHYTGHGWTFGPARPPPPRDACAPGGARYGQTPCANLRGASRDPENAVITNTDGPSITEEGIEELLAEVDEVTPDEIANLGAVGGCGEAHGAIPGVTLGDGVCLIWDGEKFSLLNMFELGAGVSPPHVAAGATGLVTNATSADELEGNAWCVGGSGGGGATVSGEVCINYTDDWERPNGIWTVAVGAAGSTGEVHLTAVQTDEVAALTPTAVLATVDEAADDWWTGIRISMIPGL